MVLRMTKTCYILSLSLIHILEWSEEAVWFLAGVYSREDAEYEQLLAEGDIHEMLDFMVLNTARRAARLLTESITAEVLFVRFYIAENMEADQEPGLEDPAAYRRYIEEHMAVLNEDVYKRQVCGTP